MFGCVVTVNGRGLGVVLFVPFLEGVVFPILFPSLFFEGWVEVLLVLGVALSLGFFPGVGAKAESEEDDYELERSHSTRDA